MKITTIEQELTVKMQEKIDFNTFKLMTAIFTESKRRNNFIDDFAHFQHALKIIKQGRRSGKITETMELSNGMEVII